MRYNKFYGYGAPTIAEQIKGFSGPVDDALILDPKLNGWDIGVGNPAGTFAYATPDQISNARALGNYSGMFWLDGAGAPVNQAITNAVLDAWSGGIYAPANGGDGMLKNVSPWVLGLLAVGAFWLVTRKKR